MKITKRPIKACDEVTISPETVSVVAVETCPYQKAIDSIQCAIDSLCCIAKEDSIARESIANLSVVLFDLKG